MSMIFREASWQSWIISILGGKVGPIHDHTASDVTDFNTAVDARINNARGANNGIAPLDSSGRVPSANLPTAMDEILEFANLAGFPGTGAADKIYVDLATNKIYRWGGSAYTEISPSPGSTDSVPEGSTNKYYTDSRARNAVRFVSETTFKDGGFMVCKQATVSGGNAVYHLTDDGTSGGAALFPSGPELKSLQLRAIETDAPHMFGTPVLSNGNKTLTVPVKKSAGINVALLGLTLLGAPSAANGSVVDMTIHGN